MKNIISFSDPTGPPSGLAPLSEMSRNKRVVELADLLEEADHPAELVVGVADEPGVDLHHPREHLPGILGKGVPFGHVGVVRRQLGAGRDDAHLELALVDDLAVLVPAGVELALVLVGPLLGDMVRRVAGAGAVVQVERLVRRVDVGVLDELDRPVGQVGAQVVAVLGLRRLLDRVVVVDQFGEPLVGVAAEEAVEALEPAAERPPVVRPGRRLMLRRRQMPLADQERVVAVRQQHLAQHALVERQDGVVARDSRSTSPRSWPTPTNDGSARSGWPPATANTGRWCACWCSAARCRRTGR